MTRPVRQKNEPYVPQLIPTKAVGTPTPVQGWVVSGAMPSSNTPPTVLQHTAWDFTDRHMSGHSPTRAGVESTLQPETGALRPPALSSPLTFGPSTPWSRPPATTTGPSNVHGLGPVQAEPGPAGNGSGSCSRTMTTPKVQPDKEAAHRSHAESGVRYSKTLGAGWRTGSGAESATTTTMPSVTPEEFGSMADRDAPVFNVSTGGQDPTRRAVERRSARTPEGGIPPGRGPDPPGGGGGSPSPPPPRVQTRNRGGPPPPPD